MWKVILILILWYNQSDINIVYSSPQSYANKEACEVAKDGDDRELDAWIGAKVDEFVALPVEGTKELDYYCAEATPNDQPI